MVTSVRVTLDPGATLEELARLEDHLVAVFGEVPTEWDDEHVGFSVEHMDRGSIEVRMAAIREDDPVVRGWKVVE